MMYKDIINRLIFPPTVRSVSVGYIVAELARGHANHAPAHPIASTQAARSEEEAGETQSMGKQIERDGTSIGIKH